VKGLGLPMRAEILPTHTPALFAAAVGRVAGLLRAGDVVALPTETVYGLAANALDVAAVAKIFALKQRPAHNPIIVHVASLELARQAVGGWPPSADRLARAFWPGPLTLVLPRGPDIPDLVTAGGSTVGVRWPSHPFIQAVIRECGFPLAAPSANLANCLSPTNAAHVADQLGDRLQLIVDGGPAQVGIESTVIDLTVQPGRVLRPGMIHEESLRAVLGEGAPGRPAAAGEIPCGSPAAEPPSGPLRSPGQLRRHYAPQAQLVVLAWLDEGDLRTQLANRNFTPAACHVIAHARIPLGPGFGGVTVIPHDAQAFARALYAELHRCDAAGAGLIVVEALPDGPEWRAIADRLRRATAG
jgi:L-threonylcarbamoyladenylate synthase